jgi:hypothetical protein
MSAIIVDTLVKTTISSSPSIQSPTTLVQPISPSSAKTMVELHQDNPVTILNIAKGLAATIQKREEQNTLAMLAFADKVSELEKRVDEYQNTVPLPTSNQPEGYIINDKNRVPNFIIPTGDGEH